MNKISVLVLLLTPLAGGCQDVAERPFHLYVLDGGTLTNPDPSWAGVTIDDVKGFTSLPSPAIFITHPEGTLLWDSGLGDHLIGAPTEMTQRGPWGQVVTQSVRSQLAELGYGPEAIDYFALSHMHFDHVGNASDYSDSIWLIQEAERDAELRGADPLSVKALRRAREGTTTLLAGDHDVFGDGSVVIKSTPGHTAGHQSLFVNLPMTGPVIISGDLWHYSAERELGKMPEREVGPGLTAASRQAIEEFAQQQGAELWIQHEPMQWATLRKSPDHYE